MCQIKLTQMKWQCKINTSQYITRHQVAEFDLLCVKHKISMPEFLLQVPEKGHFICCGRQRLYPQVPGLYFSKSFQTVFPLKSWILHILILMWISILQANNVLKKSQNPEFLMVAFLAYYLPIMTLDITYQYSNISACIG